VPRKYPPLTPADVIAILKALGFQMVITKGSHQKWRRTTDREYNVTVDLHYPEYYDDLIKSMIAQSGVDREQFYGATKKTAKKIR